MKPGGYCKYRQFNTHIFYVLSTRCIYAFCVDMRKKVIISLHRIKCLVFKAETECVFCAVRTGSLNMFGVQLGSLSVGCNMQLSCASVHAAAELCHVCLLCVMV